MTAENPKPHANHHVMIYISAWFQVSFIKGFVGTKSEPAIAITSKNGRIKTEIKKGTNTSSYYKSAIYKLSNQSNEIRRRCHEKKFSDGQRDGRKDGRTHIRTEESHF